MRKIAQQEIVGFVLIVIIVMVAGLVFLLISAKNSKAESQSSDLDNFISSILIYTSDCAPIFTPNYDNIRDLIVSCNEGSKCKNLNKDSCEYLNETLKMILEDYVSTRNDVSYYKLEITSNNTGEIKQIIPPLESGKCVGNIIGTYEPLGKEEINLRFRICKED